MAEFVSSISPSLSSIMHGSSLACDVAIRVRVFSIPKFRTVWRPSLIAHTYGAVCSISSLPVRNSWLWDDPSRSRARITLLKLFFEADRIFSRKVLFVLRSEEHTSELQSQSNLVCRLLLEKKKSH